jgi:hypothetical protein
MTTAPVSGSLPVYRWRLALLASLGVCVPCADSN